MAETPRPADPRLPIAIILTRIISSGSSEDEVLIRLELSREHVRIFPDFEGTGAAPVACIAASADALIQDQACRDVFESALARVAGSPWVALLHPGGGSELKEALPTLHGMFGSAPAPTYTHRLLNGPLAAYSMAGFGNPRRIGDAIEAFVTQRNLGQLEQAGQLLRRIRCALVAVAGIQGECTDELADALAKAEGASAPALPSYRSLVHDALGPLMLALLHFEIWTEEVATARAQGREPGPNKWLTAADLASWEQSQDRLRKRVPDRVPVSAHSTYQQTLDSYFDDEKAKVFAALLHDCAESDWREAVGRLQHLSESDMRKWAGDLRMALKGMDKAT